MSDDLSLPAANQCQLWWTPVYWHTFFRAAPCNVRALQPGDTHAVDNWRKRIKRVLFFFFFPFLEDIISRWAAEAVNFSQTPPPPPLCLEANPLISCVSMVLQRTILYVYEKERRREEKKSNSFFVPHLYNHFEMAAVLLWFVSWEAIWSLCKPEWEKMLFFLWVCRSVFGQKLETIMPLQCLCGSQILLLLFSKETPFLSDHGPSSYFLVFKTMGYYHRSNQFSPARVYARML